MKAAKGMVCKDIVIVGGGPVGAAAALGLARAGHGVTLLEARASMLADDRRTLAIAYGSKLILEDLGAWPAASEVTPITNIHVTQKGHFGQTVITAEDARVPALGYVMRYNALVEALARALTATSIEVVTGAAVTRVIPHEDKTEIHWGEGVTAQSCVARLAVLADGGRALTAATFGTPKESPYAQVALVAQVHTNETPRGRAYERFTPSGPVALLPFERHYALVWTGTQAEVEALVALPDEVFLARLQRYFGDRAGQFLRVNARSWFPLTLKVVKQVTRPHAVCIGNAAQTMHPVAGQGFNLGLRDAAGLCQVAQGVSRETLGSADMLARYVRLRARDRRAGIGLTHALVTGFSNRLPLLPLLRGNALTAMNLLPITRRALARVMMFGMSSRS
ncbi:MAG: FAD-dependent monooxygenase [Betaproteobacteria bacterium]|nr:FAD-dependent monooxygenase [Betaproteobacteria bacterium]